MPEDDETEVLGAPPMPDLVARAMRRNKIANQLFDTDEQVRIGRYQLLEKVGAGGIGVVWGAWDPELERRVAIKVLRPTILARDRIVDEGQALAKLSHPNVVPVYDVGIHDDDQVYLVMEWVRGETLRAYCAEPRSSREILALYRAAGEGLAAAHASGLIHRDFKPDNAIRGDDGRVRVLDFGLARGEPQPGDPDAPAPLTRGAGTPRYMAPEQVEGTALSPVTDQYALCVSLREALEHRGVVPGWVANILDKGTSRDPGDRYESMHALLRALARDPATVWRRRLLAAGAAGVAVVAFALGTTRSSSQEVVTCAGSEPEIAKTWNSAARDRMLAHLRSLGSYGTEEADRLAEEMASYASGWATAHRDTCLAHERREMTEQVYERNLGCLAQARVNYSTVVEVLTTASSERLSKAIVAARGLPALDRCAFDSIVSAVTPPPKEIAPQASRVADEIERARILARTDDPNGIAATKTAMEHADALGYTPLIARAYLAHGHALLELQSDAAIPVLEHAAVAAIDAFDDPTFVEAYARETYAQSVTAQRDANPTRGASTYVEHVARRSGVAGSFARALLYNNLGVARLTAGDPTGARAWFDRSLAETGVRDRDAELVGAFANRALVTEDPIERARLFAEARTAMTRLLGANHSMTLEIRFRAAFFIADRRAAAAELGELCTLYLRYHPIVAQNTISSCSFELGWLAEEREDRVAAAAAMRQVPAAEGPFHATAGAYLLLLDGKLAEAAAAARTVGETFRGQSWARFNAADAYRLAAQCELARGHRDAALADAHEARRLFEQLTFLARMPNYQRRLARTQALLARLAPREQAIEFARTAAAWYRSAGGYDSVASELEAIATGSR